MCVVQFKASAHTTVTRQCHSLPLDFPLSSESFLHGFVSIVRSKQLSFRKIEHDSIVQFFLHYLAD